MKYADGPTASVEVQIAAPPERVWPFVCDIDVPAHFSRELQETRWIEGGAPPAVGDRFQGRNHHVARGEWVTVSTVTACEPGREFAWAVGDVGRPSASWRFVLEPEGTGTRLRHEGRMGPGPSGLTPAIEAMPDKEERIIARRLEELDRNIRATLAGIKALAEAQR